MTQQAHALQIPQPLKVEHDELHAQLARAARESGPIGLAAAEVARILHPHFVSEEEYALPPLGLLPALSAGRSGPEMKPAIDMAHRLKSELPRMLAEHKRSSPRSRRSGTPHSMFGGRTWWRSPTH